MLVDRVRCARETDAVDQAGMIRLVGENRFDEPRKHRNRSHTGKVTRRKEQCALAAEPLRQVVFKQRVLAVATSKQARAARAYACRSFERLDDLRIRRQAQVIVRRKVDDVGEPMLRKLAVAAFAANSFERLPRPLEVGHAFP